MTQNEIQFVLLDQVPLPPTSNHMYKVFRHKGKIRHAPSSEMKQFRKRMYDWALFFERELSANSATLREWVANGELLAIHCVFYFQYGRVFTIKGKPKRMDVSNRIKALHDEICKILGIDDSVFFNVSAIKTALGLDTKEFCVVRIERFHGNTKH